MSRAVIATLVFWIVFPYAISAQSGRVVRDDPVTGSSERSVAERPSVKDLYDEANNFQRAKMTEFVRDKVPFSESLQDRLRLEQKLLAAKNAAIAAGFNDLKTDEIYYLGLLYWIAESYERTAEHLVRFATQENADEEKAQTARSVAIVSYAKLGRLDEAESLQKTLLGAKNVKDAEKLRTSAELAKAYSRSGEFAKMSPHAEMAFATAVSMINGQASRSRGLDEIVDAGMLVFESYRERGMRDRADAALVELRAAAKTTQSTSIYYFAVDQLIKYMIDTGRKPAAMELYTRAMADVLRDLSNKQQQTEVQTRLRRREKHYKMLGEPAPELPVAEEWFPGERKTLANLKGKVVLLDFWATWCGPCFDAFPLLSDWQRVYADKGFAVLGVTRYYGNIAGEPALPVDELAHLKDFAVSEKLHYDILVMNGQAAQLMYNATGLPTVALIDRKGIVRYIETGSSPSRLAELERMVAKLVAEN